MRKNLDVVFYLDKNVNNVVKAYSDAHVVEICSLVAELLCEAHRHNNVSKLGELGKKGLWWSVKYNHPMLGWVLSDQANFIWLAQLFTALLEENIYRFGEAHPSESLTDLITTTKGVNFFEGPFTEAPRFYPPSYDQRLPTEFMLTPDKKVVNAGPIATGVVSSYHSNRNYYAKNVKRVYTRREQPTWFAEY